MAFSPEQYNIAGQFIRDNIGNPNLVNAELAKFGATQQDILQAARTQDPNISASQVAQYTGYQPPAAQRATPQLAQYQQSPYLQQMADRITQQSGQALNEQALPQVRNQAIANGGFGGSRQGIAEGLAIGRSQEALQGNLANLYNNDYQQFQNRALQQYGMELQNNLGLGQLDAQNRGIDNQYTLGLGQLSLGNRQADNTRYGIDQTYNLGMTNAGNTRYGIDTNAATSRYGTDKQYEVGMANANASMQNAAAAQANAANNYSLAQQQLGLNGLFGALDRQYAWGQGALNSANNLQNTPLSHWQQFGQGANVLGQNGGSSFTTGTSPTNTGAALLGGAQLGNAFYNSLQAPAPVASNNNVFFGTGSMGD